MTKILISGCAGRMGRVVAELCSNSTDLTIIAGVDIVDMQDAAFPVSGSFSNLTDAVDVVIDFSAPATIDDLLEYCKRMKSSAVLGTTGYSTAQTELINQAASFIPIFKASNMSTGIQLLKKLVKETAATLGLDYDIEIVESHHRMKVDAPSGTALTLADAAKDGLGVSIDYAFERESRREPRRANEIGISALRGGTIPGEHRVVFAGRDEVIEFKHTIYSREVFAAGAVRAARFISGIEKPGLYAEF